MEKMRREEEDGRIVKLTFEFFAFSFFGIGPLTNFVFWFWSSPYVTHHPICHVSHCHLIL